MTKKYTISYYDLSWECSVEIDEEFVLSKPEEPLYTTKDAIKDMVEFWAGWQTDLRLNKGDYTKTLLQKIGRLALYDHLGENHNLQGVIGFFEEAEGWIVMDGTKGIRITYIEEIEFYNTDFEVEEVK